jgi:hypothetical protein
MGQGDALLVLLCPVQREGMPRTVEEIEARIVELAFDSNACTIWLKRDLQDPI